MKKCPTSQPWAARLNAGQWVLYVCAVLGVGFWTAHPIVHNHLPDFSVVRAEAGHADHRHDHDHDHSHSHGDSHGHNHDSHHHGSDDSSHGHSDRHEDCALIGLSGLSELKTFSPSDWLLQPIVRRLDRLPVVLNGTDQFDPVLEAPPRGPPSLSIV